jgi:hypothetical protein
MASPASDEALQSPHPTESKLSVAQQAEVRSPEFTEWFGDWQRGPDSPATSKIVDPASGEPQIFYHGTNREFDISAERGGGPQLSNFGLDHDYTGIYVAASAEFAKQYADPIGASWDESMSHLARVFGKTNYTEVLDVWNDMMLSCQADDGAVVISEGFSEPKEYPIGDFAGRLENGDVNFGSTVMFNGTTVCWLGEFLTEVGGSPPRREDELVAYTSLYPAVQLTLDKLALSGKELLIPARAMPRIIPVFVKAVEPLVIPVEDSGMQSMDMAFADGFRGLESDSTSKHDAVIANGEGTISGVNIAVLSPSQLREANVSDLAN